MFYTTKLSFKTSIWINHQHLITVLPSRFSILKFWFQYFVQKKKIKKHRLYFVDDCWNSGKHFQLISLVQLWKSHWASNLVCRNQVWIETQTILKLIFNLYRFSNLSCKIQRRLAVGTPKRLLLIIFCIVANNCYERFRQYTIWKNKMYTHFYSNTISLLGMSV